MIYNSGTSWPTNFDVSFEFLRQFASGCLLHNIYLKIVLVILRQNMLKNLHIFLTRFRLPYSSHCTKKKKKKKKGASHFYIQGVCIKVKTPVHMVSSTIHNLFAWFNCEFYNLLNHNWSLNCTHYLRHLIFFQFNIKSFHKLSLQNQNKQIFRSSQKPMRYENTSHCMFLLFDTEKYYLLLWKRLFISQVIVTMIRIVPSPLR